MTPESDKCSKQELVENPAMELISFPVAN